MKLAFLVPAVISQALVFVLLMTVPYPMILTPMQLMYVIFYMQIHLVSVIDYVEKFGDEDVHDKPELIRTEMRTIYHMHLKVKRL